jgi:malate/lactate dehydrogenase
MIHWQYSEINRPFSISKVKHAVVFIPLSNLHLSKKGIERMLRKKMNAEERRKLENVLTSINDNIKLHQEL